MRCYTESYYSDNQLVISILVIRTEYCLLNFMYYNCVMKMTIDWFNHFKSVYVCLKWSMLQLLKIYAVLSYIIYLCSVYLLILLSLPSLVRNSSCSLCLSFNRPSATIQIDNCQSTFYLIQMYI